MLVYCSAKSYKRTPLPQPDKMCITCQHLAHRLLQESELTPTGANLLDGRYAVFGYAVEGADLLQELQTGDKIDYIKVTQGLQYLQQPKAGAKPAALGDTA